MSKQVPHLFKYNKNVRHLTLPMIDGTYRSIAVPNLVGCCYSRKHRGYLDKSLCEQHQCASKGCKCFRKFEDFPYWIKQKTIQKDKDRKLKAKRHFNSNRQQLQKLTADMLIHIKLIADAFTPEILVTNVIKDRFGDGFIINYVSNNTSNDYKLFLPIAIEMSKFFKVPFILKHVKDIQGNYVSINNWYSIASTRK